MPHNKVSKAEKHALVQCPDSLFLKREHCKKKWWELCKIQNQGTVRIL